MSAPMPPKKPQPSVRETWAAQSRSKKILLSTVLALLGLCFVGLLIPNGDKSDAAQTDDKEPAATEPAKVSKTPSPAAPEPSGRAADCLPVPPAMVDAILSGPEDGTGKLTATGRAAALRSPEFKKLFFIAVEFKAEGVGSEIGVWASNDLQPGQGLILAASEIAQEFTVWPDGDSTDAEISSGDPTSLAAEYECLGLTAS